MLFLAYPFFRASILDFKPKLANRCKVFSGNILLPAEFVVSTVVPCPFPIFVAAKKNGPPATTDATTIFRVRFLSSLRQRRMARLQRSRGVQAGTGCHEGGIILSKKPSEWHLPLPQPSSRYDEPRPILIFLAAKKNSPPAAWSWDAGRHKMPRRRHSPR